MSIENPESKQEKSATEILADRLDELQSTKNDGRGISCVRTLIMYLRKGGIESAKAVYLNEGDKIRSYPDIKRILEEKLMKEGFKTTPRLEAPEIQDINLIIIKFNKDVAKEISKLLEQKREESGGHGLDQKEIEALAAMNCLPKDPLERMLFIEEYEKHPDARWSDSALTALEALKQQGKNVRVKIGKDWRNCLSYPQHLAKWAADKLDEIATLIDMPKTSDRYTRMDEFLEIAKKSGLLNDTEFRRIRTAIAQEL